MSYLFIAAANVFLYRYRASRFLAAVEDMRGRGYGFFIRCTPEDLSIAREYEEKDAMGWFLLFLFGPLHLPVNLANIVADIFRIKAMHRRSEELM